MNLYEETDEYTVETFDNFDDWLKSRGAGIGGSDASALCGVSHFKTLQDLWFEKIRGQKKPVGGPAVDYGRAREPALRTLYQAKHLDHEVQYQADTCLVSKKIPWMRYSPDGLIWEPQTGRRGILEIKTAMIRNGNSALVWEEGVPIEYYLQILHGLIVTGFDFVVISAELRSWDGRVEIIERSYTRTGVADDIKQLLELETANYNQYFVGEQLPPLDLTI